MLFDSKNDVLKSSADTGRIPRGGCVFALVAFLGAIGCTTQPDHATPTNDPNAYQAITNTDKTEQETTMTKATMIPITAMPGQESDLRSFLELGRALVAKNEPGTPYWYALKREGTAGGYAIFDLFPNQAGRDAHFNGDVAAALANKAPELVRGGWQDGVVANVQHYDTIAQKLPSEPEPVTKATYISLRAVEGQADALAAFLVEGCKGVTNGEPLTPYWLALRSETDDHRFAIVDFFPSQEGREAHFGGAVAAALKANADTLVAGGWDEGVLGNVAHFDVVAAK